MAMSDEDDPVPKQLLQPSSMYQSQDSKMDLSVYPNKSTIRNKPYQISFSSRDDELHYTQKLKRLFSTYDGNSDRLVSWLEDTGRIIREENYPETDHPFIIRHLLIGDALTEYQAHDDVIFNFYDLRRLFLNKIKLLAPLRTISTLNAIGSDVMMSETLPFTSTHLDRKDEAAENTVRMQATTFGSMSLEDVTINTIRKLTIEDIQRGTSKFTGEKGQDVIRWLKTVEAKYEAAGLSSDMKLDLVMQLLDKSAFEWFLDNRRNFNNSWIAFTDSLKKTFGSPNRARMAMQKLATYVQTPNQSIHQFCSEMRKLFTDVDPNMSSTMKLEYLLSKVKPSYRFELLKLKPKSPEEFEMFATELENVHLAYELMDNSVATNDITNEDHPLSGTQWKGPSRYLSTNNHVNNRAKAYYTPTQSNRFHTQYSSRQQRPNYSTSYQNNRIDNAGRSQFPYYSKPVTASNYDTQRLPQLNSYASSNMYERNINNEPALVSPSSALSSPKSSTITTISRENETTTAVCQLCDNVGHTAKTCPFEQ